MSTVFSQKNISISKFVLAGMLSLLLLAGCAGVEVKETPEEELALVWPLPPEKPRIKFIREVSRASDAGGKSGSKSLLDALAGVDSKGRKILVKPYGVHSDGKGRIYVADSANGRLTIFDSNAEEILKFGEKGIGRIQKAMGVVTDQEGKVYVADAMGRKIVVFDSEGKFIKAMGGKDILTKPIGIALDENRGRVYVADSYAHQVIAFDLEGEVVFTIGKKNDPVESKLGSSDHSWNRGVYGGEFRFPTNIAIDKEGKIYVVDTLNFRVQIFTPEGKFLSTFGEVGNGFGQFVRPKGIALDSEGHIYVTDAGLNNVQIFDAEGRLLLFFGKIGLKNGEFWLPAGISINASDQIHVADQYNHRIQVFQFLKQEEEGVEEKEQSEEKSEKGQQSDKSVLKTVNQ